MKVNVLSRLGITAANEFLTDKEEIKAILEENGISSYEIHNDGVVDALYLEDYQLKNMVKNGQLIIQFGEVSSFRAYKIGITTLKGCPKKVGEDFFCGGSNKLTSLKNGPEKVGRNYYCGDCKNLTSLEGAPKEVGGEFDCSECKNLKSLEGAPKIIRRGKFICTDCPEELVQQAIKQYGTMKVRF